ncbi:alkaline shock response membrane anchor protein AmaP [Tetragenococcus koreensis]|uniref:Alkaline shock response membrane anchor protein AmaP n=1 Tax=Tetragenococcus koreensis TaxID=290335 RepID=A0AAN4RLD5_9ENTE|nr:alkaline shock response membrane anchor protein AmaP [Tetragenococcus koreensis]MDN6731372.1 alkaline shock response membrane anchor protein AmaP [Atopostipes suicloacalis]AYW45978.1 alkaline shock response membrane anchor protein AmaP [Tetragenococcus koreensis]MCF1616879.1 alkaline shock response membrane anchor protein AmaP [Tetragenococcus koreensis]MCF1621319.1 alkaline shock response membrane anchor protein AmaP [Tetragenococcus koreensis]MCF1626431.1 alkaline shock response membrane 
MGKLRKSLIGILLLLLIFTLFFVLVENQEAVQLPVRFISMYDYPWIGMYMQQLLFWFSALLLVLTVLLLVITIFYPRKKNTLVLEQGQGTLKIQKKAVENFVLQIVNQEPFVENPAIKVKMYNKKIRIKVSGYMKKVMAIPDKQNELVDEIQSQVSSLMGTTENIKTEVSLENYRKPAEKNAERVK